jgi:hypothetical protein
MQGKLFTQTFLEQSIIQTEAWQNQPKYAQFVKTLKQIFANFSADSTLNEATKSFFWFPRAGVGTDSARASIQFFAGLRPLCSHLDNAFPRRRVGTRNLLYLKKIYV